MNFNLDAARPGAGPRPDHDAPWPSARSNDSQPVSLPAASPMRPISFNSFWMAAFEGSDHINHHGEALALNELTGHQTLASADYERAAQFQMRTVRESVGWRLTERDGQFDFSHLEPRARAAATGGVQVIWTLLHYGWPAEIDILSEAFVRRFARYAAATAMHLARYSAVAPVYAPIHEISYLAWALCESDLTQPGRRNLRGQSAAIKRQLVRAALAACDAIWAVDPRARILHSDPLVHIAAPAGDAQLEALAANQRELQFEAWDMLSGRLAPELGGAPRYLDLVGLNYFPGNQWELGSGRPLDWHLRDARRADLSDLLAEVHQRYNRPLLIAETGHTGVGRGAWIREVADQVRTALAAGVPVQGICLYAVVDRPDWNNPSHWHGSGLWDFAIAAATPERRLNHAYAADLRAAQEALSESLHQVETKRRDPAGPAGKRNTARPQLRGVKLSRI
ncbi:MAG: putative protoporphyrinogen oxidase [Betaproteobacteria bacterium]|nr:putative protoporphyrinogen oxidase [Betaproteobacteria bacterium]